MYTDISTHEDWFTRFTSAYCRAYPDYGVPMELKIRHTAAVLLHARRIIDAHHFDSPSARATVLAALYHDVGRFPQYARWQTFKDSLSVNHGLLGLKTLKRENAVLAAESPAIRRLVLAAVGLHNKFAVATHLPVDVQQVTHAVRDADKCDIIRIMVEELGKSGPKNKAVVLHVQDDPALWTPKVVEDILNGKVAAYADLHSINDFRLLLASWLYDLRFAVSKVFIKHSGQIEQLLDTLPPDAPVQAAKKRLLTALAEVPATCNFVGV
ncbi:MAG: HD domain-containing protein [Desulfovibrionaceae bacterium]